MKKQYRKLDEYLKTTLADPERARGYLQLALEEFQEDGDMEAFLTALRSVAQAQGGIAQLTDQTGINRQHLYKALSNKGNPKLDTLTRILQGLGFRLRLDTFAR